MGVGIRIDAYRCISLRRAVSHAGGLSCMLWYVGLGMGVRAVLGPVQRRFAFVSIQTMRLGQVDACLMSSKPGPGSTEMRIKYCELWPRTHPNIVNCGPEHMYILPYQCININGEIENSEQRYRE